MMGMGINQSVSDVKVRMRGVAPLIDSKMYGNK